MKFDPVSDGRNFTTVKSPDYFKQQLEEMHAAEVGGLRRTFQREALPLDARNQAGTEQAIRS